MTPMPFSLRAARAAIATVATLLLAVAGAVVAPHAGGQPSSSPSGSPSGSPGPAEDELGVTLLNPSTGYDDPPKVGDRFDGTDTRYTIVARTTGTAESAVIEASLASQNSDGTYANEITIGELAPIAARSDVWQLDWDIPSSIPEGPALMTVRAYVDTPSGFVETGSDAVGVDVFYRDPTAAPLGAYETVDVLWPEQGGPLGWYKPRVGAWRNVIDGTTSPGATHVRTLVSTTPPGETPAFVSCGSAAVVFRDTFATFSGRCTLDASTRPSAVTAVAAVAEYRETASGVRFLQAADVRTVSSYAVSPERMSVVVTPVARRVLAPAAACQSFTVTVTDDHGRPVLGANVDVHATGPADALLLTGTALAAPDPHAKEQTQPCPSGSPVPGTPVTQGDHNVPGGIDAKHMETIRGTGLDSASQLPGQTSFLLASDHAGFTELTAWVDDEEITRDTDQRPPDDDRLDPAEPIGHATMQWLTERPALSLDPLGGTAPAGSCFPYVVKARAGTAPLPGINVDVHATGPDAGLDFCDPGGASERRAPVTGAGANAHEAEDPSESHHFSSTGPAAQHSEGETDSAGNLVVGLTSPVTGDSTVVAWIDGEPGSDDDVQQSAETSASGTVSWATSRAEADLGFVNPSPYGGHTEGTGTGTQVPDDGGAVDVLVRVDLAGAADGVEILLATGTSNTFSSLGEAERVGSTDLYRLEWPVDVPDGSYKLRARLAGTSIVEDLAVTVGAGELLPTVPKPPFETLELHRPQVAAGAPFSRRSTIVAGRASAGAEGVDVYYTKVPSKDTPRLQDWVFCGYAGLGGTGTARQDFSTPCTLAGADQAAQVTGIAAITYDCTVDGCDANPRPEPPAGGAPAPREPGQKDTGDAVRVFGYEAHPLLAIEPPEAEAVTGDCRRFEVVLRDQTGQPIGDDNVDLHLRGPSPSTHFCRPSEGATGSRAPDGGGHTTTGADPAVQLEAAHEDGTGAATLHTEGETLPDGTLVFGVTSEAAGDGEMTAWVDRDDDDLQDDGEPSDTGLLHWVAPRGCLVVGSEGPDVLRGTAEADVFCGLEGNDVIRGGGGADTVFGGAGADRIFGGAGGDTLRGARGDDLLNGGPGRDSCRGGPGRDRIARCESASRERERAAAAPRSGVQPGSGSRALRPPRCADPLRGSLTRTSPPATLSPRRKRQPCRARAHRRASTPRANPNLGREEGALVTRAAPRPPARSPAREVPVHRTATRGGTPLVVGVVEAGALRRTFTIPRRDARTKSGYQRELSQSRVNRLVKDLRENRVDLPTSILVNLRDFQPDRHLVERKGRLFFRHGDESLYVVDGQHRVEALARLVDEDEARWGSFEIPFVCMLGATEREEIRQFYVVNSTAKSVRTDLALDLLKQRAESEPGLMDALIESGETWKIKGQQVVEDLAKTRLWRGRTRFPGEPKGETTIGSAGLVGSLRPLLNTPYFGALTPPNQVKILDAYWEGVAQIVPECFVRPTEYTLQKTTGVNVMHGLLVSVLEYVRSVGRSVVEPEVYADVLGGVLPELEGDTTSGEIVRGSDFWLGSGEGAAGSYSSNAGRRVLTAKLRGMLPPIEVE